MGKKCIGVDVGGTSVKLGIFDVDGVLLKKWEIPTRKEEQGKYVLDDIAASIRETLKDENISMEEVVGVGIDVPGPVKKNGYVEVCVNLGWRDIYPAKELSARLDGIPAECGNDANAAALGEMWKGGGEGYSDIVMVTLGTGVGGGVIINEKIIAGRHGLGGEIGHIHAVMMSRSTATVAAEAVWSRWRPRPESPERHAGRWQLMTVHPFCVSLVMK